MSRNADRTEHELRALLRAADPAADGCDPTGSELSHMRRRVLDRASVRPVWLSLPLSTVSAASAVVALTLILAWNLLPPGVVEPPSGPGIRQPTSVGPASDAKQPVRQIQFSTPGGTRVVWTLDPDFKV